MESLRAEAGGAEAPAVGGEAASQLCGEEIEGVGSQPGGADKRAGGYPGQRFGAPRKRGKDLV